MSEAVTLKPVTLEPATLSRAASFHQSQTPEARLRWIHQHLGQEAYEKALALRQRRRGGTRSHNGEDQA